VYDGPRCPESGLDEESPRLAPVRDTEDRSPRFYGGLKVACEDDVVARLGPRATVVRPGIVAGPHDTTDRFTYWARRAAAGGRVAVPGRLDQPVQVVDSRDLARLCTVLLEDDRTGVFNAVGPAEPVTLAGLVAAGAAVTGVSAEPVAVAPAVREPGFPLVLDDPEDDRHFRASAQAARSAGMPATPLTRTAADTWAWDRDRGAPPIERGFTPEQEAEALAQIPGA
jgi:2'-hydroxyisoflavone reductase